MSIFNSSVALYLDPRPDEPYHDFVETRDRLDLSVSLLFLEIQDYCFDHFGVSAEEFDRVYLPRLRRAVGIASYAHAGERRKSGESYMAHVIAVARNFLQDFGGSGRAGRGEHDIYSRDVGRLIDHLCACVLHDTIENVPDGKRENVIRGMVTYFSARVIDVVEGVTKDPWQSFVTAFDLEQVGLPEGERLEKHHLTEEKIKEFALRAERAYAEKLEKAPDGALRLKISDVGNNLATLPVSVRTPGEAEKNEAFALKFIRKVETIYAPAVLARFGPDSREYRRISGHIVDAYDTLHAIRRAAKKMSVVRHYRRITGAPLADPYSARPKIHPPPPAEERASA